MKSFPTLLNAQDWKKEDTQKGKEWVQGDLGKTLNQFESLCKDAKFTTTGNTCGELHLFSTLHQIKEAGATLPGGLLAFHSRLAADEKVKKCLAGESKMGQCGAFIKPFPS